VESEVGKWPTGQWKEWTKVATCPCYDGRDDQVQYSKYKMPATFWLHSRTRRLSLQSLSSSLSTALPSLVVCLVFQQITFLRVCWLINVRRNLWDLL